MICINLPNIIFFVLQGPCELDKTYLYLGSDTVASLFVPHGEVCLLACRNAKECMYAYYDPVVTVGNVEVGK